jgi:prepilin-type N-terminal cleavage/methylation domain-containing protein
MSKTKGFTLVELLVVIAIIALLMSILMPALARVRKQAKSVICRQQLKQWGLAFSMYTTAHDGSFMRGCDGGPWGEGGMGYWWMDSLRPYYKEDKLRLCPLATKLYVDGGRVPFGAWLAHDEWGDTGSYGPNGWICNPPEDFLYLHGRPTKYNWRKIDVQGAGFIPLFLDALWVDAWPMSVDQPATTEYWLEDKPGSNEMRRFCANRHNGCVNVLFMDLSVRPVGLRGLWKLKWHQKYDINGPWTVTGGVMPDDWPEWIRYLPDFH